MSEDFDTLQLKVVEIQRQFGVDVFGPFNNAFLLVEHDTLYAFF